MRERLITWVVFITDMVVFAVHDNWMSRAALGCLILMLLLGKEDG